MNARAEHLRHLLALEPHLEGGHFRRIYESTSTVAYGSDKRDRPVATSIYYLLCAGEISRWHRIDADEIWHWYEGQPLEMFCFDPVEQQLTGHRLGPVGTGSAPAFVIPAGCWQAARPLGEYALVGCTVAPAFVWEGFGTLADESVIELLRDADPGLLTLL